MMCKKTRKGYLKYMEVNIFPINEFQQMLEIFYSANLINSITNGELTFCLKNCYIFYINFYFGVFFTYKPTFSSGISLNTII